MRFTKKITTEQGKFKLNAPGGNRHFWKWFTTKTRWKLLKMSIPIRISRDIALRNKTENHKKKEWDVRTMAWDENEKISIFKERWQGN